MAVRDDDPRRFLHPETIAKHQPARPPRQGRGRGLHLRHAPQPVLRPLGRVRAAPRIHPWRRHPPPRLEGLVEDRPLLHQAVRGRNQPALHAGGRCLRVDALRPRAAEQIRLRLHRRRLPRLPAAAAARFGRLHHLRFGRPPDDPRPQPAKPHRRHRQRPERQPAAREDRPLPDPPPRHRNRLQPRHDRHRLRPA